jgi:hypothetical protein
MLAASTGPSFLSQTDGIVLLGLVTAGALIAGGVVIYGRQTVKSANANATQSESVIRSWIAITLVIGLLIFCAAAFLINDSALRSTLFGGLVTSVGAAVAFYFSSKSADQARADVVNAMAQSAAKPVAFSQASPPPAKRGTPYLYRFVANGQPPPTYHVASGKLPAGLVLDPGGTLYGTPSAAGVATFTLEATNTVGSVASGALTLTVT